MFTFHPVERLIYVDSLVTLYDFSRPKGYYFPGETHNFWECVFLQEGSVTATADERVYQLEPGMLLLHKPMEFHRMWAEPDCAPWVVNISFTAHGELLRQLESRCFNLSPAQQDQFRQVVAVFSRVLDPSTKENLFEYEMYVHETAYMLETFLIGLIGNDQSSSPRQSPNDERYRKIVQVMQKNCHQNLSIAEIAQLCEMSTSNLKRIFHQYSDVGIAKYFLTLKVRRAMELLDGDMPVNQVATELCFPDVAYFYTVFKRETGVTPTQYRQNNAYTDPQRRPL